MASQIIRNGNRVLLLLLSLLGVLQRRDWCGERLRGRMCWGGGGAVMVGIEVAWCMQVTVFVFKGSE